jgi:hypothetical protein
MPTERWPRAARERFARQFAAILASRCADTTFLGMAKKALQLVTSRYMLADIGTRSEALERVEMRTPCGHRISE